MGRHPRALARRSPETEAPLNAFLEPEGVKLLYLHGHRDPERISPDNWNIDIHFLERPGARQGPARPPVRLPHECRAVSGVAGLPPRAHAEDADPVGENDIIFGPEGGRAYLRDLPEAELHMLDSGHFAVEDSLEAIAAHIKRFHAEQIVGHAGAKAVEPAGSARSESSRSTSACRARWSGGESRSQRGSTRSRSPVACCFADSTSRATVRPICAFTAARTRPSTPTRRSSTSSGRASRRVNFSRAGSART